MRKIILMMSVSLDGFFETADRDISWHRVDDELLRHSKFVLSRTLTQAGWNTTVIHDVVPEEFAELKAQPGGDIALSGAEVPRCPPLSGSTA